MLVRPQNGFLYVLDVKDGKLISADPFTPVNWATGIDPESGRPIVVEGARYEQRGWNLAPGVQGGHSWHPNAYSPDTGLVYIPTWEAYFPMIKDPAYKPSTPGFNLGIFVLGECGATNLEPTDKTGITGRLKAWDPVARKSCGKPRGSQDRRAAALPRRQVGWCRGDGRATGCVRWMRRRQETVGFARRPRSMRPAITYELDGEQYVAASVGGVAQGGTTRPAMPECWC